MAVYKCKMCGGDLAITEGVSVVECETFEIAGDNWKFEYISETTKQGEVVKSEPVTDSGSIFWKFALKDGKVSFSDKVGDYTDMTKKEYYELPDLSLENGEPSFETNKWVKQ